MKTQPYSKYTNTLSSVFSLLALGNSKQYFKRSQLAILFFTLLSFSFTANAQNDYYTSDAILTAPVNPEGIAQFMESQHSANSHARMMNEGEIESDVFGKITGPDTVCSYEDIAVYSVGMTHDANGNPLQYHWFVPADWIVLEGQGTNELTVIPGMMSGQVAVFAVGFCICSYACKPVVSEDCGIVDPLPVEFISFEAARAQSSVLLNWATAQEKDNDRFEVERSLDGKNFSQIGTVKGNGTTNSRVDYSFTDGSATNSVAYYRLKQVDTNGDFEYSPVRAVQAANMAATAPIRVYPNPATDAITIEAAEKMDQNGVVRITSVTGQTVWSGSVSDLTSAQNKLNISHLNAGVYIATISSGQSTQSVRIIKN